MGTNQPVKISDAKSGIIRRLIDVHPTGIQIPTNHYNTLLARIDFELGAIAQRCLEVYLDMGETQEKAKFNAIALLEAHVVKHPDYVPELHSEIDPE